MRSQVQVLAGPPTIPAGHSAVGSGPGTPTTQSGPRWGRTPIPSASAVAPSGTIHRGVRLHDHHASWSRIQPGWQPRGRCGHLTLQPAPAHSAAEAAGAPHADLAWSRSGPAPPSRPAPYPAQVRHRHPTDHQATSAAPPGSRPARPLTEPLHDVAAPAGLDPFPWCRLPATATWFPAPPPAVGRDGRVRTAGADSSRLDGWTPDGLDTRRAGRWTRWTPGGRTLGGWTAGPGHGTAGWTPHGGHRPATSPDRWVPAGRSAGQPPSGRPTNQDRAAARTTRTGPVTCRDGQLQVPRRPAGASAHCSPRTISARE
jgi:hypothetical protein